MDSGRVQISDSENSNTDNKLTTTRAESGARAREVAACSEAAGAALEAGESLSRSEFRIVQWLEAGADLETDILPVLRRKAMTCRPGQVRSWAYFTEAVMGAFSRRASGAIAKRQQLVALGIIPRVNA
ncbi:hypothetical protein LO749_21590 (plasmid) [Paracoccus denitrificans]|uniref:hypothetical protein n=1 Tax=Paracoccus denitrificans TaxID=266 RepID=UPI001E61D7FC|nr:hypothetical protein [Paracoccus denitrificans]UFS68235.1 hypothetical protein LO749_21590 [Paracoccus denitrificans]